MLISTLDLMVFFWISVYYFWQVTILRQDRHAALVRCGSAVNHQIVSIKRPTQLQHTNHARIRDKI